MASLDALYFIDRENKPIFSQVFTQNDNDDEPDFHFHLEMLAFCSLDDVEESIKQLKAQTHSYLGLVTQMDQRRVYGTLTTIVSPFIFHPSSPPALYSPPPPPPPARPTCVFDEFDALDKLPMTL